MASSFTTIEIDRRGPVLTVALNRPQSRNAFTAEMSVELGAALRLAQREDAIRCLVITGREGAFCSGQDLKVLAAVGSDQPPLSANLGAYLREAVNPVVLRLRTMEKPVVAAVNGAAAGAGAAFALATDVRVCAQSAVFTFPFARLGLVPDAATTLMLVQHVGYSRAAALCLLGEPLTADAAHACGLALRVVPDEDLADAAWDVARQLADLPPIALKLTKRALAQAWTATLEQQLELEAHLQTTAGRTEDHHEGLRAFLEKRPPRFKGR